MGCSEIVAIILAAGYSKRMHGFKPLLDLGGRPVIARIITTFIVAGIYDVRVVTGYNREELIPVLKNLGVKAVHNDRFDSGMFSSIQTGVNSLEPEVKAFFILPADIPLVRPRTIRRLAENYMGNQGKILIPCYRDRKGHPPLIASSFRKIIMGYTGDKGLKEALRPAEDNIMPIPVEDENILFDMDSLADYRELQKRWEQNFPSNININQISPHTTR